MLISYVHCMRYAVLCSFGLSFSVDDVLSRAFPCKKSDTPFIFDVDLPSRKHLYCYVDNFVYCRFWNKNHFDYFYLKVPKYSGIKFPVFNDFNCEVSI